MELSVTSLLYRSESTHESLCEVTLVCSDSVEMESL